MEIDRNPRKAARRMIQDGVPLEKIARMTGLDTDTLQEIDTEHLLLNATVSQIPQRVNILVPPFPEAP